MRAHSLVLFLSLALLAACSGSGDSETPAGSGGKEGATCTANVAKTVSSGCFGDTITRCDEATAKWVLQADCAADGKMCKEAKGASGKIEGECAAKPVKAGADALAGDATPTDAAVKDVAPVNTGGKLGSACTAAQAKSVVAACVGDLMVYCDATTLLWVKDQDCADSKRTCQEDTGKTGKTFAFCADKPATPDVIGSDVPADATATADGGGGKDTSAGGCGGVSFEGCCSGSTLKFCDNNEVKAGDCAPKSCGWNGAQGFYDCMPAATGADPSGKHPLACPTAPVCTPACTGKQCGPDGCNGSCGTCPSGTVCGAAGTCVASTATCGNGACEAGETNATCAKDCPATPAGKGCEADPNGKPGCGGCPCEECVCKTGKGAQAPDPYCCSTVWDKQCSSECKTCLPSSCP